ncbi:mfs-type transporter slc18b1 [Stylonychia lemnae]|uniref:Mfs-type transporter slc18b1 n=1 Tax=Stylonychia lemnae TaxID=5949 RepID=A0A078AP93_STYLE|nr:mfs-type transporter slc18b1 [Stylonychia lemnae]|eukprot:CDW83944.1 mfs-type transporter slc18b1 [Stylonychia lemnae]
MIAPFYPETALEKGVSHLVVGYIFSAYPIANLLFAELLFIGCFYTDNHIIFISLSMIARILQGIACSGILSATYAVLLSEYPEHTKEVSVTQEMSNGVGYMIGPVIGSLFFKLFGFVGPFIATGILQLFLIPLQMWKIPGPKDNKEKDIENRVLRRKKDLSQVSKVIQQRSYFLDTFASRAVSTKTIWKLLKVKRLHMATLANFISYLVFVQVEPVLAPQLLDVYKASQNTVCIGFSCGVAYTCYFPEAIEGALEKYPDEQEAIGEVITVLYTNSFALAEILAPILSTHFKTWYGYRESADIFALMCLIFFIFYYFQVIKNK